ncbi:hypothetical protein [Sphingomonas sp. IC081]|uniref:hypothetical protein n=1 Tax=Sphingomonas sp. IC081 TaxID=304378 RepID=UPI00115B5E5C|nr:hypothetical protein [Sphingomonas sp. IC081]QDK34114.1 hypothetical protein DM450_15300 [Sphingomonas sp. IC081]
MYPGALSYLFGVWAAALALLALPAAAHPQPAFAPGSVCTALADSGESAAALARDPARWDCSGRTWPIAGGMASFVRIDMAGHRQVPGETLNTRLTGFTALSVTALGADGQSATRPITEPDLHLASTSWTMEMPLPRLASGEAPGAYVLKVVNPRHKGLLSDAVIAAPADERAVGNDALILAALCGLMIMPLVLNFAIFRVLRQPFALWHALGVFAMLMQTAVGSGLINRFVSLSLTQICALSSLSWSLIIIGASRFFDDLLEPGMLDRQHKRLLLAAIPWVLFWALYYNLASGPLLASAAMLYYASFLPFILLLGWTMTSAAAAPCGSRSSAGPR